MRVNTQKIQNITNTAKKLKRVHLEFTDYEFNADNTALIGLLAQPTLEFISIEIATNIDELMNILNVIEFEKRKKEIDEQIVETKVRISAVEALNRFSHHVVNLYARGPHLLGNERDLFIALFVPGSSDESKSKCIYKNDFKSCIDDFQKYDMSFYKTFLTYHMLRPPAPSENSTTYVDFFAVLTGVSQVECDEWWTL